MDIKTDTSFWKYKTNGHFLPIKGIKGSATNFTMVKLADPHYKYAANYNVKVANAYKANTSHWRQAIIW